MPPQSETARKLFRALGKDPDAADAAAAAGLLVVRQYAVVQTTDPVDAAYEHYLRAVDAANNEAANNAANDARLNRPRAA